MSSSPQARGRRSILVWCLAFCAAMIVAGLVVHRFDPGWAGTLAIMLVATGMTIPIIFAVERSARFEGCLSPAMARYNRRMIAGSLLYTLGLFVAVYAYKTWHPQGALLWGLAMLPALGALAMVAAMARLLVEEQDEYLRLKLAQSALFGTGVLLVLATVWGFLEQFRLVPHVPAWAAIPVFAIAIGLSRCFNWARA